MSKLVTIYGGSGFVGRHIAQRMAKEGWRVRVAVRRPNEAMFVKPYGSVGQVEPVFCNVRDDASVAGVMAGADAVVNCVGILSDRGKNTFDAVQHEGAERIARIASEQGVATMVHLSAIADTETESDYATSKALGEEGVIQHMPNAMILRPSVIFGQDDGFFNRFASMSRMGPMLPIIGGETKFQPVFVDDVAQAAVMGILGQAEGVYELGGPEVKTLRGWIGEMLEVVQRKRIVMNLPFWLGRVMAFGFGLMQTVTFGLVHNSVLTKDQVRLLKIDNVVSEGAKGFDDLGIRPLAPETILPDYLWRYRPSGQYDAIKDSARNMKI
ncbi:3-beta hydroxysteroid dehydrogenase/isomerase family protein [Shimia sp. SK013]|uniref:complex I NDUFA9 subunit family protein n=1 Tax=Shimia sp. SK013 TaxID=1389006 RepID=UPI0006B4BC40|nr:complex I NDUFA9 subunit family protein [Shimia sp. SK013]KPA23379.1 3-beta hydroxysteroid dehydrogenase/isomerase family protein [Shimia sp. SK013]